MRRILLPIGALGLLAGPLACGSAPPPPAEQPSAAPIATAAATKAGAGPDCLPVAEPADVIGVFRWKNPVATLTTAGGSMPPQILEATGRMAAEQLLKELFDGAIDAKKLSDVVALDAPVDGVMTLDPNVKKKNVVAAFSIGLTSLDGAKQAVDRTGLVEVMPSVWKVGATERSHGPPCVIAAAAGVAPARLVCGGREKDLTALVPYMTRTLPTAPAPAADLHGELRLVPIDARYGDMFRQLLSQAPILARSELAFGDPTFDRAIVEGATGLADELGALSTDLDKLTFDLTSAKTGITGTASVVLRGKTSWTADALVGRADRAGAPPDVFWRVPVTSDWAYFSRGDDPARYAAIHKVLHNLIEGALAKVDLPAADRKAVADLWPPPMQKDAATACAGGQFDKPAPNGGAKPPTAQETIDLIAPLAGWTICGSEAPPATVTKYLKDAVAAYNRPGVGKALKKALGNKDAKLVPTIKTVAAPAALGAGALDIEVTLSLDFGGKAVLAAAKNAKGRAAKPESGKMTVHLLAMADGNRVWTGAGMLRDDLVKQLLVAKTGAPDAGTLASRAGLEALKNGKTMAGGFTSLRPAVHAALHGFDSAKAVGTRPVPAELEQLVGSLRSLPNHGETPILFETTASAAAPAHADATFVLPKGAIEDLSSFAVSLVKLLPAMDKKNTLDGPAGVRE